MERGILYLLFLIPVRIVPEHSDEHHIRTTLCVCGRGGGRYAGAGRGILYLLFLIPVRIVPEHSDEPVA